MEILEIPSHHRSSSHLHLFAKIITHNSPYHHQVHRDIFFQHVLARSWPGPRCFWTPPGTPSAPIARSGRSTSAPPPKAPPPDPAPPARRRSHGKLLRWCLNGGFKNGKNMGKIWEKLESVVIVFSKSSKSNEDQYRNDGIT